MRKSVLLSAAAMGLTGWLIPATATADGAQIQHENVVGDVLVNPCNGETVTITSGTFQIVDQATATPSGGFHVIAEGTAQGVKGIGTSGTSYQAPGGFWIELNVTPGAQVSTEVGVLNLIGQGTAPDFRQRGVLHITVDAGGYVTASIDMSSQTCTGS
jgi:hypothetical protein